MPRILLPFEHKEQAGSSRRDPQESDELYRLLPEPLQTACQENRHLWDYLCLLPLDNMPIPEYAVELKRSHGDQKQYNLIYPVKGNTFVHLYSGPGGGMATYIPIEPDLTQDLSAVLPRVEERLLDEATALAEAESDEQKTEAFLQLVDKVCQRNGASAASSNAGSDKGKNGKSKDSGDKVKVTPEQLEALKYIIVRDKVGMGTIDPMIRDTHIEDISCSGLGHIFLEHKVFKGIQAATVFESYDDLDDFALSLSEHIT